MLLYGPKAWTLLSTDAAALRVFERKVLRKIFGPVRVADDLRIQFSSELYELRLVVHLLQKNSENGKSVNNLDLSFDPRKHVYFIF